MSEFTEDSEIHRNNTEIRIKRTVFANPSRRWVATFQGKEGYGKRPAEALDSLLQGIVDVAVDEYLNQKSSI